MNIAIVNIYGDAYSEDKLFDINSCKIGQNLLLPGIVLKKELEKRGDNLHTADMYDFKDIDVIIFQDLHKNSKLLLTSLFDYIKYFLKRKWKEDYLLKATRTSKRIKKILIKQNRNLRMPKDREFRM